MTFLSYFVNLLSRRRALEAPLSTLRVWHVDREGRVRTDKDRPVVLKAKANG